MNPVRVMDACAQAIDSTVEATHCMEDGKRLVEEPMEETLTELEEVVGIRDYW